MKSFLGRMNGVLVRVMPLVALVVCCKLAVHWLDCEWITVNAVFTGIIGANVFLLGFLLSGVLGDYKESERLPGEIAGILSTIADELACSFRQKENPLALELFGEVRGMADRLERWFHKKEDHAAMLRALDSLYERFGELDGMVLPNYIVRLKQEHNNLRRILIRIYTIRETSFVSSGYIIAITTSALVMVGLVLSKMDPFYESLFFVGVISYLLVFVIMLIHDLDNPFGYYESSSSEDVSLQPLQDLRTELARRSAALHGAHAPETAPAAL